MDDLLASLDNGLDSVLTEKPIDAVTHEVIVDPVMTINSYERAAIERVFEGQGDDDRSGLVLSSRLLTPNNAPRRGNDAPTISREIRTPSLLTTQQQYTWEENRNGQWCHRHACTQFQISSSTAGNTFDD